jgi:uncharacterized membrane protein
MDEFSYLSVLFSIIVGLTVAEILQGFRRLLLVRDRVRVYWPVLVWGFSLLAVAAQTWWTSFGLRYRHDWTFAVFGIVLLQTILVYMQAGLVFPDFSESDSIDLRDHYFRQHRWFFSILGGVLIVSVCKDLISDGKLPSRDNLLFHIVFFGAAMVGVVTKSEPVHKFLAIFSVIAFGSYIIALFSRLQ